MYVCLLGDHGKKRSQVNAVKSELAMSTAAFPTFLPSI